MDQATAGCEKDFLSAVGDTHIGINDIDEYIIDLYKEQFQFSFNNRQLFSGKQLEDEGQTFSRSKWKAFRRSTEIPKSKYAFTITPSPHKKHSHPVKKAFKDMTHAQQQTLLVAGSIVPYRDIIENFRIELTKTTKLVHIHGILVCTQEEMLDFCQFFIRWFGYAGKHNKAEDFVLIKEIFEQEGWERYMKKEDWLKNVKRTWQFDYFTDVIE